MKNKNPKILIIGYGSIGKKHCEVLKNFTKDITILTKQKKTNFKKITAISEALEINPEYIVIACETSKHLYYLNYIEKHFIKKTILVEKPIMNKFKKINLKNNTYFVGYNLRFHPVLLFLKKILKKKIIYSVNINCTSFLPNWRKNIKYEKSSTAIKKMGGGLILDLSHELDYIYWLFGKISLMYSYNKKVSNLKINTDDFLILVAKLKKNVKLNLFMNFFSRFKKREINIEGKNFSLNANLITCSIKYFFKNKEKTIQWSKYNLDETYLKEHNNIFRKKYKNLCKVNEALDTLKLIDKIKKNNNQ